MGIDHRSLRDRALEAWPTVVVDEDVWRRHLAGLGWEDDSPPFPDHLYIACACGRGDAEALRIVDGEFFEALRAVARRKLGGPDAVAEALQLTRERLFTGSVPRIMTYRGSGHLRVWLLMVMNRVIASSKRSEASQRQHERALVDAWEDIADGLNERPSLRPEGVARIESCLQRVFAALPARDRAVMKLYYLEGLSLDAIGVMYRRHRSQVARWLVGYRDRIRDALRNEVRQEVGAIAESELGSLLRLMQDEIDVTISTLLESTHGSAADAALPAGSGTADGHPESRYLDMRAEPAPPRG